MLHVCLRWKIKQMNTTNHQEQHNTKKHTKATFTWAAFILRFFLILIGTSNFFSSLLFIGTMNTTYKKHRISPRTSSSFQFTSGNIARFSTFPPEQCGTLIMHLLHSQTHVVNGNTHFECFGSCLWNLTVSDSTAKFMLSMLQYLSLS